MLYIVSCVGKSAVALHWLSTTPEWWQKVARTCYFNEKVLHDSFVCTRCFITQSGPTFFTEDSVSQCFPYCQASFFHLCCNLVNFSSPLCHLFRCYFLFLTCASSHAVVDLVYWRHMRRTGVVFTGLVISLASLFQLSAITVLSHICLGIMCVTFSLRLYYKLLELLRWNPGVHPFQWVPQCFTLYGSKPSVTLHLWLNVGPWLFCIKSAFKCGRCTQLSVVLRACMCVSVPRSYLDNDSTLTDKETVMLVEEVVLLIAFAVTELKRLLFINSMIDSFKVRDWW